MEYRTNFQYMRPKKAAALRTWQGKTFDCRQTLEVDTFRNAVILPIREFPGDTLAWGRGGMLDREGYFIPQSGIDGYYDTGYSVEDACPYRDCRVVYCGYLVHHWGHFLLDAVPRLWYSLEEDTGIDKYVFMVKQGGSTELTGNYRAFFRLLGILDRVELIDQPTRYREVLVPELSYDRRKDYWSRQYGRIFETVAGNVIPEPDWEPKERIFLSRGHLPKAMQMEAGLDLLDHYFSKNGYTVLYPEQLSLDKLIYLLRNAKQCVAESGSLPHNMLFGRDGQSIVVVERYAYNNREFPDVQAIKGLDVTYIDACMALYPVELAYGPFIFYYNNQLQRFTRDRGYRPPDEAFVSRAYRRKLLKHYFAAYTDEHRYQWYMPEWLIPYTDSLYEAYEDSMQFFGEYMKGKRPFLWHHYFELHYVKQWIKRILGRA